MISHASDRDSLSATDCIQIEGIRAYGYIGYLPEEQVLGQWFEVSLTVWKDLSEAGKSDDLAATYDYSQAVTAIQQLIQIAKHKLIEKLAEEIAALVLTSNAVEQVKVRLTKLQPPIPNFSGQVSLEIVRRR
ncbi:MAG: dihydroneopterin aldolase [Leptolyngbya sp. IPPAS B-1204]|nr:dihydroneopterin aldolase [Elainella sp. C42_A2020_010]RNJ67975.1 MAG: dihydroneopterin aldolase [Leptolyngbya sp. IPPAS B-1204]